MDETTIPMSANMRELLRRIFGETLAEIAIPRVFASKVECSRGVLRIEQDLYDLSSYERVLVIAMGKAAHTMLESLIAQTGTTLEGIVMCSHPPESQQPGFRYFLGGHPLPNAESVRGARAILKYLAALNDHTLVIYLISGGASAIVETFHDEEISLDDLISTYQVLVHSGATIGEINTIRKHLSAIKGGRTAQLAYPARQVSIMVSDVPEHSLDALASGPTMPDSTTTADCYRIAQSYGITAQLPGSIRARFAERTLEETPKADDPAFTTSRWWPILSSSVAARTAAAFLSSHGFAVEIDDTPDDWPYDQAADYLLRRIRELRTGLSRVALISAGEITVKVTGQGGIGGRNQHFALHCARQIAGKRISILSSGTDGIDGNSPAAGAVVDGSTIDRARELDLDVSQALERFDSFAVLQKLGDAVITGPTGNNVRDLRLLLAY
jgi:hydroxypyruvate reductase